MRRPSDVLYEEVIQVLSVEDRGVDSASDEIRLGFGVLRERWPAQEEHGRSACVDVMIILDHVPPKLCLFVEVQTYLSIQPDLAE